MEHNNEELRNTNGCHLVTQFSSNPTNRFILSELSFLAKVTNKIWTYTGNSTAYYRIKCIGQKVIISSNSVTLNVGETHQLELSERSYMYPPRWSSDDTRVAEISQDGLMTAIAPGIAKITCNPIIGPSVYCDVTVKAIKPETVTISPNNISISEGETQTLKAVLSPKGASSALTWSSDDVGIATIDKDGNIYGVKCGSTEVKVVTENGLSAKCEVNVVPQPTEVHLPNTIEILEGFDKKLKPTLTPENSKSTYTWISSNTSVATVSPDGNVSAKAVGTAYITVTTANRKTAKCQIVVKKAPDNISKSALNTKIYRIKKLISNTKKQY